MVDPYNNIDTTTACKKSRFITSDRSDFHTTNNLSIAFHTFTRRMLTSLLVDKILLPTYVNSSSHFRGLSLKVEIAYSCLKHEFYFICFHIDINASWRFLCSRDSTRAGVFPKIINSSE